MLQEMRKWPLMWIQTSISSNPRNLPISRVVMLWLLRGLGVRKPQSSTCRNAGLFLSWVFSASWRLSSSQILGHICWGALCGARLHLWANYTTPVPFTWYDVCVNPALKFSSGLVFCWRLFPRPLESMLMKIWQDLENPGTIFVDRLQPPISSFSFSEVRW